MPAFAFNLVRLNNASTMLGGISSPNLDRRENEVALSNDGTLHQTGAAVIRSAPMVSFTSVAVRALFIALGTGDEIPFVALDGTNGIELFGAAINTAGPGYLGSSVHAKRQMLNGGMFLRRVSWSPGDIARAEVDVYGLSSNGTTNPVTASTAALPTIPTNTEQLVLASVVLNALSLTNVSSFDCSITHQGENNDEDICFSTGLPYPILMKQAGVGGATEVTITIETLDLTSSWTNGTVVATFKPLLNRGVGLDTTTAVITLNTPTIRETIIRGEDGRAAKRQLVCRGLFDGTNKPLTITTT
jgi:hypothetical protein